MRDIKFLYKDGQRLTGTHSVTGISDTVLSSNGAGWISNQFVGESIIILSGTGINTIGKILSNGGDTITVQAWDGAVPASGDKFVIENPNYSNKNKFYYGFRNEIIYGRDKLIQDIVKPLLTTLGSNLYSPDQGSDFMKKLFKKSYSIEDNEELKTVMTFAINDIKQKIVRNQTNLLVNGEFLTDSEILKNITINKLEYNKELFFWDAELLIETKAGTTTLGI